MVLRHQKRAMDRTADSKQIQPVAANAFEDSEARYRDILEFVPVALVRVDRTKLALNLSRLRSRGVPRAATVIIPVRRPTPTIL